MKNIPKEIEKIMTWLAKDFHKSMKSPLYDKEDLYNDLVVFYLEKYDERVTKQEWFIRFKNLLINKYGRVVRERKIIKELSNSGASGVRVINRATD